MAKSKGYTLKYNDPFPVAARGGTYVIPPLEEFSYKDFKDVIDAVQAQDAERMIAAYRTFFTAACPEIAEEHIGDNQWLLIGEAYLKAMGE